jgi:nonsense-mediated mRNA decay protein 3
VLIKKSYDRSKRARRRNWKLKEMERDREGLDVVDERYPTSTRVHPERLEG